MRFRSDPSTVTLAERAVVLVVTLVSLLAADRLQRFTLPPQWDALEYVTMARQAGRGEAMRASEPFGFRVAWPWVVGRTHAGDEVTGFRRLNAAAVIATALALPSWFLAVGVRSARIRLLLILLWLAEWHGPARFLFFSPTLIDAPSMLCLVLGLLNIERYRAAPSGVSLAGVTLVSTAGALCRESMILIPLAFLFVENPVGRDFRAMVRITPDRLLRLIPLLAAVTSVVAIRMLVHPVESVYSTAAVAVDMIRSKSPLAMCLGLFVTFGPVITLVAYDWRRAWAFLTSHQTGAVVLAASIGLAYVGGTDTERILFWSAPVVYALIGRAILAHWRSLSHAFVLVALTIAQLVSARLVLDIPPPSSAGALLDRQHLLSASNAYAVLDRLLAIDGHYFNLWSFFAGQPWQSVQLASYLAFSFALWLTLRRLESPNPVGASVHVTVHELRSRT